MELWAQEFAHEDTMPQLIKDANAKIAASNESGTLNDPQWRKRLEDRLATLKSARFRVTADGDYTIDPQDETGGSTDQASHEGAAFSESHISHQGKGNETPRTSKRGGVSLPNKFKRQGHADYTWSLDLGLEEQQYAATWTRHHSDYPNGLIIMNPKWSVFVELQAHWLKQFPAHRAKEIIDIVQSVYGEAMVARIAHSEELVTHAEWGDKA